MALTSVEFHVLLALFGGPNHGYALMLDAFRQARREHDGDSLLLWRFLLVDLGRSTLIAHFDAARTLLPPSVWRWAFACGGAAALTALVANALTRGVGYLYHPYLE